MLCVHTGKIAKIILKRVSVFKKKHFFECDVDGHYFPAINCKKEMEELPTAG